MTIQSLLPMMIGAVIVLLGAVLLGGLVRRYRREIGIGEKEREKTPDTAFVINAFHEVTKQLKERKKSSNA